MEEPDPGLVCRPLDSYAQIRAFVACPPAWRALARPLAPHSALKVRNAELGLPPAAAGLGLGLEDVSPESPLAFCHMDEAAAPPPRHPAAALPRTLVCHDMANGYHDDCHVDGTGAWDAYTFYNWAGVDTFCYFSHHLVTVPPLGWINAAHAHGVKVLGTLITEWAEGVEFWDQALSSDDSIGHLASALTAIASALSFDGWLLNVENKVGQPDRLLQFVGELHAALHAQLPHAELIWYDSVTIQGDLNWQNKLNDKNRAFFDACDGLFTNYSWTPDDVESSAVAAGERRRQLYVGVDVWGRNAHGGGMFNTQQAVRVVHAAGCSLALFAPAWTHEALELEEGEHQDQQHQQSEQQRRQERFRRWVLRDRALWGSLWPFLHTRLPSALPFRTSFCRGQGRKRRHLGEVLGPTPWFNVRHQQYQPNAAHGPHGYVLATQARLSHASRNASAQGLARLRSRSLPHQPPTSRRLTGVLKPPPPPPPPARHSAEPALADHPTPDADIHPLTNSAQPPASIPIDPAGPSVAGVNSCLVP